MEAFVRSNIEKLQNLEMSSSQQIISLVSEMDSRVLVDFLNDIAVQCIKYYNLLNQIKTEPKEKLGLVLKSYDISKSEEVYKRYSQIPVRATEEYALDVDVHILDKIIILQQNKIDKYYKFANSLSDVRYSSFLFEISIATQQQLAILVSIRDYAVSTGTWFEIRKNKLGRAYSNRSRSAL